MLKKTLPLSVVLGLGLVMLVVAPQVSSQDKDNPAQAESPAPRKVRGRLPNFYAAVVTQDQREEIYAVQAKYAEPIAELEKQLAELEEKRDAEVEAVLTPEQRAEVKKRAEEARKEREKRRAEAGNEDAAPVKKPGDQ